MDMKRIFLYAILIAAMALAGCGGNGGGGGTGGNGMPMGPTPAEQLSALLTALTDAGLTVTADSTAADIMRQLTAMSDSAREAALETIRTALGLTGMEDADDIADEITARLGPPGPAPTLKTRSVTFGILGLANLETGDPNNPSTYAGIGAMTRPGKAVDGDKVHVRAGSSDTATTAAIGVGTDTEQQADFNTLDILDRVEMIADPDSDDAEDMIPDPANFMEVANSEVMLSKGFTSTNYLRSVTNDDDETTTDEIAVITDMKDPGAIAFDAYYTTANIGNRDGASTVVDAVETDTDTTNVDETKLHLTVALATTDDFADLFDAPEFRSTGTGAETLDYGPDTDANNEYRATFEGNFNGIPGTYTCDGTCMATLSGGKLTSLVGTWQFTPDNAKAMIPDVDHDSDFLAFGWWLRSVPVSDDEDNAYSVGTFATGSDPYTVAMAQRAEVTGTAKYSGPAGGKFALKTLNSDGSVATLRAGHFTADASLTATFGQTSTSSIAPNQLHSITGTVNNFEDGYGNDIDSNWTVTLMKAGFGTSGSLNERDSTIADADTFGGMTSGNGTWQGRFFGPDTGPDGPDADTDPDPVAPSGVAGEFTNHWSNGHVIGAFGATRDE